MTLQGLIAERFEIDRLAGEGGMGAVYRAWDRSNGAVVALKVLHRAVDTHSLRFEREARVLSELDHPGIVRYVSHGDLPTGEPYLIMEWLEGESLATRLERELLTAGETLLLAERVAAALGVAHERGIVHRDLKPGNLFLVDRSLERVKILDFGIARVTGEGELTDTAAVLGTAAYMAPEQARSSRSAGASADVYALGCVMFRCLVGRTPFLGETPLEILMNALTTEAPTLAELRDDTSAELGALVARLLAREPSERPADGRAAAAEIRTVYEAHVARAAPSRRMRADDLPAPSSAATRIVSERVTEEAAALPVVPAPPRLARAIAAGIAAAVLGGGLGLFVWSRQVHSDATVASESAAPAGPSASAARAPAPPEEETVMPVCFGDYCERMSYPDATAVDITPMISRARSVAQQLHPAARLLSIRAVGVERAKLDMTNMFVVVELWFSDAAPGGIVDVTVIRNQLTATRKQVATRPPPIPEPGCALGSAWAAAVAAGLPESTKFSAFFEAASAAPAARARWRLVDFGVAHYDIDGASCALIGRGH